MDRVRYVVGYNFSSVFDELFKKIQKEELTRRVGPRGKQTIEFAGPTSWTVHTPWNCWQTRPGRKLNPFFAAAEIFWILSGSSSVKWICRFNENMRTFADKRQPRSIEKKRDFGDELEPEFNAAYGGRIRYYPTIELAVDQVAAVVSRLKQDRDTRRACIGLWDPLCDNLDRNDIACNNMVYFLIRDNLLHTTVIIRSNDLVWGTPYNMLQFQHLALLVQGEYNHGRGMKNKVGRGHHTVVANSLHMYLDAYDKYDDIVGRLKETHSVELNQEKCASPINFKEFDLLYHHLDANLRSVENTGELIANFNLLSTETYWDQLAALPVLYLAKKHGHLDKREVLDWSNKWLDPLFTWLIADFWGLKINEEA